MNSQQVADQNLRGLLSELDLPGRAYELAERRYKDLGEWLRRPESSLLLFDPHVFVQGSFALGTAVRPINDDDEYDLDFTCKLRQGLSRDTHTQKQIKDLIGLEMRAYREARQVLKPLVAKNRCWRLGYKDELPFHMDVVPGLRADTGRRSQLQMRMEQVGVDPGLAAAAARRALWITDMKSPTFDYVSSEWPSSNPGGYQLWFAYRMRGVGPQDAVRAQVDPMPVYRSKTPLQQCIQLMKRHRDAMFSGETERKPASIIVTTIAATAYYSGESLSQTVQRVLNALEAIRRSNTDTVLNPVNPHENFADRWARPELFHLHLKANFHSWIAQASRDFEVLLGHAPSPRLAEVAQDSFKVKSGGSFVRTMGALASASAGTSVRSVAAQPTPPRPWGE